MIIEEDDQLAEWIKRKVTGRCFAKPAAFAEYTLALLRKNVSIEKLRETCESQLNAFMGAHTKEFVDSLFDALRDRSYIATTKNGSPLKSESAEWGDEPRTISGRPVRRRISPPPSSRDADDEHSSFQNNSRRRHSRSPSWSPTRDRRSRTAREWYRRSQSRSRSRSPHRLDHEYQQHQTSVSDLDTTGTPLVKSHIRCRDYEEQGVCRRGDACPYDHGPNPIVLQEDYQPPATSAAPSTEVYNPETPSINGSKLSSSTMSGGFVPNFSVPPPPLPQQFPSMSAMVPFNASYMPQQPGAGFSGGFARGRGRGRFWYSSERIPPNKSLTIEVHRIPPEINKIGNIYKHFEQFGEITSIQICFNGSPDSALVTYARLPDAQAAFKSEKAILDNRFIRVSWHNPPPPGAEVKNEQVTPNDSGDVRPVIPLLPEPMYADQPQYVDQQQPMETENEEKVKKQRMRAHLQKIHKLKVGLREKQATELKAVQDRIAKAVDPKVKGKLGTALKSLETLGETLAKEIQELDAQLQVLDAQLQAIDDEQMQEEEELNEQPQETGEQMQEELSDQSAQDTGEQRSKESDEQQPQESETMS